MTQILNKFLDELGVISRYNLNFFCTASSDDYRGTYLLLRRCDQLKKRVQKYIEWGSIC